MSLIEKRHNDKIMDFADDKEVVSGIKLSTRSWKIIVVDDDSEVHTITNLMLEHFNFDGDSVSVLHAYTAAEAFAIFQKNEDIALAIVDVVMETEHAGLDLIERIREELGNKFVRLILRTGQPGAAPEMDVVRKFEINDYKSKSELSSIKLSTAIITSLRNYRDLKNLDCQQKIVEHLLDIAEVLFKSDSIQQFANYSLGAVEQLLKNKGGVSFYSVGLNFRPCSESVIAWKADGKIVANDQSNYYEKLLGNVDGVEFLEGNVTIKLNSLFGEAHYIHSCLGREVEYLERMAIELFKVKAEAALNNLILKEKHQSAQRQAIRALAHLAQFNNKSQGLVSERYFQNEIVNKNNIFEIEYVDFFKQLAIQAESKEWTDIGAIRHIERVGKNSTILAQLAKLDKKTISTIGASAQLHDLGKIFANPVNSNAWYEPDLYLRGLASEHAIWGAEFLGGATDECGYPIILAKEIALHHHEAWDGSGYPSALKGESIPIAAQIVGLIDFFDSCYYGNAQYGKNAPTIEDLVQMITLSSGYYFNPQLVVLFVNNIDLFLGRFYNKEDGIGVV